MKVKNNRWKILNGAFFSTVGTVALIEFSQVGAGLVDGVMTSRMLGSNAMAAVGLGYPLFSIAGVLSGVLALGMQSLCAKEIGRGNFKAFNDTCSATILMGGIFALLFTVLLSLFSGPITSMLGAKGNSADLFEPTQNYLLGLCIGAPALVMAPILAPVIQLDDGGKLVRIASISSAVADIILDFITIKIGMGIFGVGLASSLSYYINLAVLLLHFLRKDRSLHITATLSSLPIISKVIPMGTSMAVKRLANVIRPILINNYIISLGGTAAMTAISVKNNVSNFAEILGAGIIGTVPLTMGIVYGEKSLEDVLHVGKITHKSIFIGMGAIAAVAAIFASPIASFFVGGDSELHKLAVFSIYMMSAELITETLLGARISYLNVISKFADSQLLQLSFKLLAIVPTVLIMGKFFGVYGVLAGFAASYIVLIVIIYVVTAIRKKSLHVTSEDYLRLDESFDVKPGDVIELDIRDMEDASLVSRQVQLFCRGHGLEHKKAYFSSLALEETSRLIFENNDFSSGLNIDIRVVIQNDDIIMRIRDNGKSSYPFGELGTDGECGDPAANVGVKIIRKIAKDIKYYHTLKINYTVITV